MDGLPTEASECPKCEIQGRRMDSWAIRVMFPNVAIFECEICGQMWLVGEEPNLTIVTEKTINLLIYGKYESKTEKQQEEEWNVDDYTDEEE